MTKIIFQKKYQNLNIKIRYPQKKDAISLERYINELTLETPSYLVYQGQKTSLKEEQKKLNENLELIKNKQVVCLLIFEDDNLIGRGTIKRNKHQSRQHIGALSISLAKNFRGKGLGKLLLNLTIQEAKKQIANLKIVRLEVHQPNQAAIALYRKCGFVEFGYLPNGFLANGNRRDTILMYKDLEQKLNSHNINN